MVYLPPFNTQPDRDLIYACIRANPLGLLITIGAAGLAANQIPFVLRAGADGSETLIGHVARNNPVWHAGESVGESLVVFQASDAYISPNWYPSKAETHRTVPTWNYVTVHAYGELIIHDDPQWVRGAVGRLTKQMESTQPKPWKMADAPPDFMASMIENIVGIELPVTRLVGKWKLGQNRSLSDREGVIAGLRAAGDPGSAQVATDMQHALDRSKVDNDR